LRAAPWAKRYRRKSVAKLYNGEHPAQFQGAERANSCHHRQRFLGLGTARLTLCKQVNIPARKVSEQSNPAGVVPSQPAGTTTSAIFVDVAIVASVTLSMPFVNPELKNAIHNP